MQTQVNKDILTITRTFDAPRQLVWKAWTDPELYKKWWGPTHFTCPVFERDLRVGGKYLSCMRSPDGQDFWVTGYYREITPYDRLVYTDSFADEHGNVVPSTHYYGMPEMPLETLVTVTLVEEDGKTVMTMQHNLPAGEHASGANEGWNQSFDKLAAALQSEQV